MNYAQIVYILCGLVFLESAHVRYCAIKWQCPTDPELSCSCIYPNDDSIVGYCQCCCHPGMRRSIPLLRQKYPQEGKYCVYNTDCSDARLDPNMVPHLCECYYGKDDAVVGQCVCGDAQGDFVTKNPSEIVL